MGIAAPSKTQTGIMPNFNTESNLLMTELTNEGKMIVMSLMLSNSLSIELEEDYCDYDVNVFRLSSHSALLLLLLDTV